MTRIYLLLGILLMATTAMASSIHLKDGRIVEGRIVEENPQSIRIESKGGIVTFYADEVGDVDGRPLGGKTNAGIPKVNPVNAFVASKPLPVKPITPEKRALIMKFIEVFGTKQAIEQNFQLLIERASKERPEEAQKIKDNIKTDELIEVLIPVYDRNFSQEDLQAFIDFYGSASGRKLLMNIPALMRESVEASARYIQQKFPELAN